MFRSCMTVLLISVSLIFSSSAFAHYLSVYVDNYHPEPGENVTIYLGYGHSFPEKEPPKIEKIEKIYLIDPDGREIPLAVTTREGENLVQPIVHKFEKSGTYLFVAERKSYFLCKTTDGYQYQSKKNLKKVLNSSWSEANAMAIINVGQTAGDAFKKSINRRFQLMADTDPGSVKATGSFSATVLLDGKPCHADLFATVAGAVDQKKNMAASTEAKDGKAVIGNLKPGEWLIKASEKQPYPDTEEADQYSFTSTLTFHID